MSESKNRSSKWGEYIKKADIFEQELEILFENGRRKLQTHCGVVFGAVMVLILLLYAGMKANIMFNYLDNTIQEPIQTNYYDIDYEYDSSKGFRVAYGIVSFDSGIDAKPFSDKIGKLKAKQKIWGELDAQGKMKDTYFKDVKSEKCKQTEINFEGDSNDDAYTFYTPAPEYEKDVKRFTEDLNCMREEAPLQGDYDASRGKQLVVAFEICKDPEGTPEW